MIYLQTRHICNDCETPLSICSGPAAPVSSALALDQLMTVEQFYNKVRADIGARHRPLLSSDFLASRCAEVRESFVSDDAVASRLKKALQAQFGQGTAISPSEVSMQDAALLSLYSRLHGLPGHTMKLAASLEAKVAQNSLVLLPQLRRLLPDASVQSLRNIVAALNEVA